MTTPNAGSVEVEVVADASNFDRELAAKVRSSLQGAQVQATIAGRSFGRRFTNAATLAIGGAALAQPLTVALAGAIGAVSAPLAALGAGFAATAAVAVPAIKKITEASKELAKARQAVADAKTPEARKEALAEQKKVLDALSPAQKTAVKNLDSLKGAFQRLQSRLEPQTLGIFNQGIKTLHASFPLLEKLVRAAAPPIQQLLNKLQHFLSGPEAKGAVDFLAKRIPGAITGFGKAIGNIIKGIAGLIKQFSGLSDGATGSIGNVLEKFSRLGESKALENFVKRVQKEAPMVKAFLTDVGNAVLKVLEALKPLGPIALGAVSALAKIINALPVSVLTALAGALLGARSAMFLLRTATKITTTFTKIFITTTNAETGAVNRSAVAKVRAGIAAAAYRVKLIAMGTASKIAAAGVRLLNLAMRANPIGLLVTALVLLAVGLTTAYKKSETFRLLVNKAFVAIGKSAITVVDGILGGLELLARAAGKLPGPLGAPFRAAEGAIKNARGKLGEFKTALDNIPTEKQVTLVLTARETAAASRAIAAMDAKGGAVVGARQRARRGLPPKPPGRTAAGGIFRRPSVRLIGEAGPEMVVPLSKGGGKTLAGAGVTQNFYVTEKPDADAMMRQAAFRFRVAAGA